MSENEHDESGKDDLSSGQGESNKRKAIEADAILEDDLPPKKVKKGAGGRPVKHIDLDRQVVKNLLVHLLKRGTPEREIAHIVNAPWATFCRWKKRNAEIWAIVENNSSDPIKDVEKALLDRAKGFYVERPIYDGEGNVTGSDFKYYPPSESAIQYYLNNKAPQNWKQKVEHNHALEELPVAINFVRSSDSKKKKAITDDFGNVVMIDSNERSKDT